MSEGIYEKTFVYINSSNCYYLNNTEQRFYTVLSDPIKNASYIKIIKTDVIINPHKTINSNTVDDEDPIYISLKNYERINTTINGGNYKFFEVINLNISDKFGNNKPNADVSFKKEYTSMSCNINDANNFVLNPVDPNLNRFDIELYDKNGIIIPIDELSKFTMTLCVYSNRKKITMF